jgi:hypothetical protein|tara:strand:- start:145 stop:519 length:375 start_codon:yes stop_codon:yes gene_type:complete
MVTILISLVIQSIIAIIALITAIIIYRLNQRIIFNEIVKQEKELRIILFDYKQKIEDKKLPKKEREFLALNHDTVLFNYYEYLAISVYKKLVNESETILYFKGLLKDIKELFGSSILSSEGYNL